MIKYILIISLLSISVAIFGQTSGTLTVTATTSKTSSPTYANDNIVAFWVEDNSGKFVKTMLAYASERRQYLKYWKAATTIAGSSYNIVDAISGATKPSHAARTGTWNGKSTSSVASADGVYKVRLEVTDNENGVQNYANFSITKGPNEQILNPATTNGFSSITIKWTPSNTAIDNTEENKLYNIYPNPTKSNLYVSGFGINRIDILDIKGRMVLSSETQQIKLVSLANGVYFCLIHSDQADIIKKFVKQ